MARLLSYHLLGEGFHAVSLGKGGIIVSMLSCPRPMREAASH
jgi:hypothetical protein